MFWNKKSKDPVIEFYIPDDMNVESYRPVPGDRSIPEWYRKMQTRLDPKHLPENVNPEDYAGPGKSLTIKRCMPVLDAMSGGYVIKAPVDINIRAYQTEDDVKFDAEWGKSGFSDHGFIHYHGTWQLGTHSLFNTVPPSAIALKLVSWFCIKTPPGYSCMFHSHTNNDQLKDLGIEFMSGIVDTDTYNLEINFPFLFTNLDPNGIHIPQGTPLVQVFPFKRETWSHEVKSLDNEFGKKRHRDITVLQSVFHGGYRKLFRKPKKFK